MHFYRRILCPLLLAGLLGGLVGGVQAQDQTHQLTEDSRLWIDGTSNRDDWTVYATSMDGAFTLTVAEDQVTVQEARLVVAAPQIVSQKSTIMDRLMHETLQVDTHTEVIYALSAIEPAPANEGSDFGLATTGQLTLAGTTQDIAFVMQGERLEDGRIRFQGSYPLLLTDYGMTPPSAMFGALRTGDEVVVNFDVTVEPMEAAGS
ncbi:MAG: YceI family protein [Bacteroidota bacterium]